MRDRKELWEKWEGRVIDGKFPLRQWLGGSDHSTVFLTERGEKEPQKAAIKLIASEDLDEDAQLLRWADAAKLSHPLLIRLFERGRCEIDGTRFLFVLMEYSEEDLSQILPLRPLSPAEATEMLLPIIEVLAFLHRAGFAHARMRPSNIMVVDNQLRISADGLRKTGERAVAIETSAYTAPEVAVVGVSPAADIWSLGATLVAALTQHEPKFRNSDPRQVAVPETIPEPFHEIARQCLQPDPKQRCTVRDILSKFQVQETPSVKVVEKRPPKERPKRWIILPIAVAALILAALAGSRFIVRRRTPLPATPPSEFQAAPAAVPSVPSPAPFAETPKPAQKAALRGSVLQQVLPDVSRNAQKTITGRIKVNVRAAVDESGSVSQATLASAVTSKYFASQALAAARRWRFNPPQVNGQPASSEWLLRFQFGRKSTQVFPSEIKP